MFTLSEHNEEERARERVTCGDLQIIMVLCISAPQAARLAEKLRSCREPLSHFSGRTPQPRPDEAGPEVGLDSSPVCGKVIRTPAPSPEDIRVRILHTPYILNYSYNVFPRVPSAH